ncbi:MAG: hypothetical protein IPK72_20370 [Candidatus Eisenbacteria bacterium]|nr:hypothetical protein [Candidatus Eisenbacteria bacterium]
MKIIPPLRVTRTYVQHLVAAPQVVLPLLCPVREAEWIEGWDPSLVISASGVAEEDCVFLTAAEPRGAIWYVTLHDRRSGLVEMIKITPEVTACRLTIGLSPTREGCEAEVTYTHTSLGPLGDAFVASFTEEFYTGFMRDWEARLNHFLRHGTRLSG